VAPGSPGYKGWRDVAPGAWGIALPSPVKGDKELWNAHAADRWRVSKSLWLRWDCSASRRFRTWDGKAGWSGGILPVMAVASDIAEMDVKQWLFVRTLGSPLLPDELATSLVSLLIKESIVNPLEACLGTGNIGLMITKCFIEFILK